MKPLRGRYAVYVYLYWGDPWWARLIGCIPPRVQRVLRPYIPREYKLRYAQALIRSFLPRLHPGLSEHGEAAMTELRACAWSGCKERGIHRMPSKHEDKLGVTCLCPRHWQEWRAALDYPLGRG